MLNTLSIFEDLSRYMDQQAARKIAEILGQVYEEVAQAVSKKEFKELTETVSELAEAQKRTETRLGELAEAQKRTETRLGELAEAQKRTETRLEELAEAQKKTEISLNRLIGEHSQTRQRLESMSDAVGYTLENQSYKGLPSLLKRDLGLKVEGRLLRRYLPGEKKGKYIQVNIYGWGLKNGQKILILGEAKTSISRREIGRFQKLAVRVAGLQKVSSDNVCQVIVVHDITPEVEEYATERGVHLYWSYDL